MKTLLLFLILLLTNSILANLIALPNFGSNPGNLNGYYYIPTNLTVASPLVIVCHGCDQNAQEIADRTEWNKLADTYGFKILYPEQKTINNISKCFNWFNATDNERGKGELESLNQMIDYMVANHTINGSRIYITGMSAGAGMTVNFAAAYPDIINRAAALAGLPYKAAASAFDASIAMKPGYTNTATVWGDKIRNNSNNPNYSGTYPKMAIFHGTTDAVVAYQNAGELTKQWCNINGADINPDYHNALFQNNNIVDQKVYLMPNQVDTAVIRYDFSNMGHVIPIDEGTGPMQGGSPGSYTQDVNFYSTYWVADFFQLIPAITTTVSELKQGHLISISNVSRLSFDLKINKIEQTTYEVYDFNGKLIKSGTLDYENNIRLNTPLHLGIIAIKEKGNLIYSKKISFE